MPSPSRAFEASFESSDKPQVPHGSDPERMLEDFDSFFEKINSLDQADWRKAHPANPERSAMSSAAQPAAPKASGKQDPLAGLRAAVAQAKQEGAGKPARFGRLRAAGSIRFALLAVVLFAVGMGLGWVALSLPGKSLSDASATAASSQGLIPEPKGVLGAKGAGDSGSPLATSESKAPATAPKEVLLSEVPGQSGEMMASSTSAPQGQGAAQSAALGASSGASTSGDAKAAPALTESTAGGNSPTKARASSGKSNIAKASHPAKSSRTAGTAKAQPAKPAQPSATAKSAVQVASGAAPASAGEAHFAVQVGACRSPRCVDSYRQLVSAHMQAGNDPLHIVTVPADGKDSGMQRVRVAPLDKASAQRLKDTLIQADTRLSGAYIVELK